MMQLSPIKVTGRRLKVNIIFVGVIIALDNESVMTNGFTSWSVSVMISSLNDYKKSLLKMWEAYPSRKLPHAQLK